MVEFDRRLSVPVGRRHLSADPHRRLDPAHVRLRARDHRPPHRHVRRRAQARRVRLDRPGAGLMDIAVLLGCLFILFALGVPIAYSLGLAAIAGAMWINVPLEAVMLKISDGVSKVAMLTIPFFVLAGAIMAEGGMAKRMVAFADVLVGV